MRLICGFNNSNQHHNNIKHVKWIFFSFSATLVDKIFEFYDGIKTFSRRFHNAGNGLIGNEDHPRILNGKNLI